MDEYMQTHAPKTCANAAGLLTSALADYTDARYRIKIPRSVDKVLYEPTDDDIKTLLQYLKGTEMEKAVLLAAFGTLRRSEIVALTYGDIEGNEIHIRRGAVWDEKRRKTVIKTPKTALSVRTVTLPNIVIKTLLRDSGASDEPVVKLTLNQITLNFEHILKNAGLPRFRFHDLRAYSASIRHALGIPDQYIMRDGGWKTDSVLKRVYRRAMDDKRKEFANVANSHFETLLKP